ncbi:MAG: NACHT domain-containing protein, partial [Chloroflexi bacterium]|nr:NACHT domain-containing protein [Chloroflexota bacterium]
MSFSTETWREKAAIQYQNFKQWLKKGDAPFIAYGTVAGLSLWPLVETAVTAPPGQPLPVSLYLALGSVAGGVGGNLIAEQLGRWRDAAEPPTAETVTQWVADNAPNPDLRAALDAVLEKLDAIPQAQAGLAEADKIQFANALRREMAELGNWSKFETMLTVGSGAVAQGDGATAVGERAVHAGNVGGDIVTGSKIEQHTHYDAPPSPDAANWRAVYLNRLFAAHSRLSLAGIDPKTASDAKESRLNLGAVYTALLTQSVAEAESGGMGREQRRLSALEQLDRHPHFVLLGDPGSGKSTFVNFVALCLAGAGLGHETVNLDLLTAPSPDEKGEDGAERQSWRHGALLPVVVVLRDFAARGLPAAGQTATANHLWQFIEQDLKDAACPNYGDYLRRELQESGGLLLLDGLDEVPQANERRTQIKGAIERFAAAFPRVRILVASRTYAYQRQAWRLPDFDAAVLAPFKPGQIRRFVDRWYAHIAPLRGLHPDDAQGRAEQLKNAIFASRRLGELAERPLLLTLMSSLHAWRGGSLPEKREELYADTVDLLLDWWEKPKTVRDAEGGVSVEQPSLAEWLKVDRDKVRGLLNRLAYDAHTSQPELVGTADIPEGNLVSGLMRLSKNPDVNPALLVAYLRDRAGLLLPRGVGVYAFPHRTFQEYLAACHLTDHEYPELAARLARQAPNRWREAALLAGAKGARGSASTIWSLVEALCYDEPGDSLESAWGAHLAGQALVETADLAEVSPRNQAKVARLQRWLVHIMRGGQLPAVERAGAAVHLARLGDPRAEA